ncbi:MAG: branched-chain amino acid ABC transporter permease [Pseudomonadota bacterium]
MDPFLTAAIAGLSAGGAYSVLGVCAIFTYRLVAVVNFSGAATGAVGTFLMVILYEAGVPLAVSAGAGVLAGAFASFLVGCVMTIWFAGANATTKAAVTAAMLVGIIALGLRLTGGQNPRFFPELVPGTAFQLAGVNVTAATLTILVFAAVFTVATEQFLERTRVGLQLRALSERPGAAALIGVRVTALSLAVWTVSGALTTLSLILVAPIRAPDFSALSLLVVPALAAALIGAFASFRAALVGGLMIGVVEGLVSAIEGMSQYRGVVPFLIILLVLLWSQREARWDEAR